MSSEAPKDKVTDANDAAPSVRPKLLEKNVIVFLNSSSGGRMGPKVLEKVRELIPESQIFDLGEVKQKKWIPEDKLRQFEDVEGVKVLICGGDGTMGWILSCIDRLRSSEEEGEEGSASEADEQKFPVAMMPLGTGNDLARSFGWGPGFNDAMLKPQFQDRVKKAAPAKLDRWLLSVMPYQPLGDDEAIKSTHIPPTFSIHKYSSAIGDPVGNYFGRTLDPQDNKRTQSVLRMGRTFSVRMSFQANAMHEQEMNRTSTSAPHHSLREPAEVAKSVLKPEESAMARSSSAPPDPNQGSSSSSNSDPLGRPGLVAEAAAASAMGAAALMGDADGEMVDGQPEKVEEKKEEKVAKTGRKGGPRAMPSISVIQRFETWESYDAVFCNYFSFGVDAVAASAFHEYRNEHPELFTSRLRNQTWYARKGFPAAGGVPCAGNEPPPPVRKYLELKIKKTPESEWEPVEMDSNLRGVVVLNLQSYGGGRNLWGTAKPGCAQMQYATAAPDDRLLEIVGISNILKLGCIMGLNKVGVRATRICQAAEVELRMHSPIHMQIDGEPWLQAPAKVNIKHYGQSTCLRGGR